MAAINEILQGFGVEALMGKYVDHYHGNIQATYVNLDDTYIPTILYDHIKEKFMCISWGDFVEGYPKRFEE
jgi:hypothetical protein